MGGDLPPRPEGEARSAPRFAVWAARDPNATPEAGGKLQRVQIIKVWLVDGKPRERVYDVAGENQTGAGVDLDTCAPAGPGFSNLCTVWTDPAFQPDARALYYARVLQNPSCRWSTYTCVERGVRCDDPASVPSPLAYCCDDTTPKTIQERAWTSPIWYAPATEMFNRSSR